MSRKTSTWPTRIFKSALLPPESEEDRALLDECYDHNRKHFNKLIHIDLSRRAKYREARSRLFPKLAALEPLEHDLSAKLKAARDEVQAAKAKTKKRDVTPELKVKVATIHAELKAMRAALKVERERGSLALDAVIGAVQSETRQRTGDWRFPALVALKARVDELGGALQSQKVDSSKAKLSSAQSRKIQLTIDNANKEWKAERNRCGCEVVKAYHEELERGGGEICSILAKVPEALRQIKKAG